MLRVFLAWKTPSELNPKVASEGRLQPIRRVSALGTMAVIEDERAGGSKGSIAVTSPSKPPSPAPAHAPAPR